ncbi:sugar transferase [Arthrobacter sp.]|jgi:exopolysaccharide biosynthesis polyprenyl glycosylphosphotransferase|uniref:sugar transferase n=1 Tax=Arthrobacter sp. TaxID=1667 RepID=UPI002588E6BA|nr:sugar transferase [Arthrobacter sp.]
MSQLDDGARLSPGLQLGDQPKAAVMAAVASKSGAPWATRYRFVLLASDALVVTAVLLLATFLRFGAGGGSLTIGLHELGYVHLSAAVAVLWLLTLAAYRSRDARVVGIGLDEYRRVISATVTLLGTLAILALAFKIDVARGYMALVFPLGVVGLTGSRWGLRQWLNRQRRYGHFLSRVIVLGRRRDVEYVIGQIQKKSGASYEVIGTALPEGNDKKFLEVGGQGIPVVASIRSVVGAVQRLNADAVIVAGPVNRGSKFIQRLGWDLEQSSTELVLATGLTSVAGPRIHARPVEGLPLMHVELPQYTGPKHVLKRLLDITLSAAALVVLLPVFAVLAILIRRDSAGDVFFRQERIGRTGEKFTIYKFRSMVQTAEEQLSGLLASNEGSGPLFKLRDDPRVTTVGKWMRKYSLDELPQFWNVLIGDMSLVGPRPALAREVDTYKAAVRRKLYIKPGLTGMWQVNGRSELNWKDSVRLDLYYVENWSLAGDLLILLRTARMLVFPNGAY